MASKQKKVPKGQSRAGAKPATRRKARMPRGKRGALATVGGLLIASALVRVVIGATEALAEDPAAAGAPSHAAAPQEPGHDDAGHAGDETQMAQAEPPRTTEATPGGVQSEADIAPLLAALAARESRIKEREAAIARRMQALSVAETEIDRKLSALEQAESELRDTIALANEAAEDDIARLTTVYSNMKPKNAAALFEEMAPEFAAGFLARMRPDAAAQIMAGLSPPAAYTISVILAGRNANVPKP